MNIQDRIAELEQIIEEKRGSLSKTSFRSWYNRANEVFELCDLKPKAGRNAEPRQAKSHSDWHNDSATSSQIRYLNDLGVKLESGLTKGRASELIEAATGGYLGSVGGLYHDGSN